MNFDDLLSRQDGLTKEHLSKNIEVSTSESDPCGGILCQASPFTAEPLRPKQFYLDTALAYEAAIQLGEQEAEVAQRAGVHLRTVRWYRRIADFPLECQDLIRFYPRLFHATWAVQTARCGPNSTLPDLLAQMQQMVTAGRTWVRKHAKAKAIRQNSAVSASKVENGVIVGLRRKLNDPAAKELAEFTRTFLRLLVQGQLLDDAAHSKIARSLWDESICGDGGDSAESALARRWHGRTAGGKSA